MLKNYFKTAIRSLARNKNYTIINIAGMAVGVSVCMTIFIIIQFHNGFDRFHEKKDRTFRLLTSFHNKDAGTLTFGKDIAFPIPKAIKTAIPEIEKVAPVFASNNDQLMIPGINGSPGKVFKEQKGVFFAGSSFFDIFKFPLLAGSYAALDDPNNVFLTKETAERYFGDWQSAVGQSVDLEVGGYMFTHGTDHLKVAGILAPIPPNTEFQFKMVVAFGTGFTGQFLESSKEWSETVSGFGCYVLLPHQSSATRVNEQLKAYSMKVQRGDHKNSNILQPLKAVHYDTQTGDYSNTTISRKLLNVLWLIAAFILLIACVNFINLSTAQAINRAKEVGVRKVLGSGKSQLQLQFIAETFLLVAASVTLATGITAVAVPYINQLLELSLVFDLLNNSTLILFLLAVTIIVTLLAGFYPSVVLSRFSPVTALKSKFSATSTKGLSLRRGLVVLQFIIAQALIIGTLVIVKQMSFFMNQPLGFDKETIVNVPFRVDSLRISRLDYLHKQLVSLNGVQAVSFSSNSPVESGNDLWSRFRYNHATRETDFNAILKFADAEFVPTFKLKLVAGRNLEASGYVKEFLVNETLVKSLGIKNPGDVLNKDIGMWDDRMEGPIVGVLKDFNDRSLHHDLAPLIISTNVTMYTQASIKLATKSISSTLQQVKEVCENTFPNFVYEYRFLDEKIDSFYKQERQLAQLYRIFATIAIFLSCLGLYGLASFMAVQRIKEVGIRKVLGASSGSVAYLFSKEFILLIAIAFALATPLAWYFTNQWLQDYAYRIRISWWLFAAGGLLSIAIALFTISFHAIKAARSNPVKNLRTD